MYILKSDTRAEKKKKKSIKSSIFGNDFIPAITVCTASCELVGFLSLQTSNNQNHQGRRCSRDEHYRYTVDMTQNLNAASLEQ